MKKSLLGLLLAVALVVPAFAQKGDMSVNGKLGLGLNNYGKIYGVEGDDKSSMNSKFDMPVSLSAEFFYGIIDNLSVGVGATYSFKSDSKFQEGSENLKARTTNIYLAVKPEAKIDSEIFTSLYLIGQIGASMLVLEDPVESITADTGLYLGFGAGTTIANQVIVELLCSSSNGKCDFFGLKGVDLQYTAVTLNVGYKFAI